MRATKLKDKSPKNFLLDVGNTAVTYGLTEKNTLIRFGSEKIDNIPKILTECGKQNEINVVISSVVPKNTKYLVLKLSKFQRVHIKIVGKEIPLEIVSKYKNNNQLGIDRKVNIYGALKLFKPPFLIIDIGTGITIDYVSRRGVFEGGLIAPGPDIALKALLKRAALLPKTLSFPGKSKGLIGRSTHECITSGIIESYAAMIDGLIERYRKQFGIPIKSIITGGFSLCLKSRIRQADVVEPLLSIKSLILLFRDFLSSR